MANFLQAGLAAGDHYFKQFTDALTKVKPETYAPQYSDKVAQGNVSTVPMGLPDVMSNIGQAAVQGAGNVVSGIGSALSNEYQTGADILGGKLGTPEALAHSQAAAQGFQQAVGGAEGLPFAPATGAIESLPEGIKNPIKGGFDTGMNFVAKAALKALVPTATEEELNHPDALNPMKLAIQGALEASPLIDKWNQGFAQTAEANKAGSTPGASDGPGAELKPTNGMPDALTQYQYQIRQAPDYATFQKILKAGGSGAVESFNQLATSWNAPSPEAFFDYLKNNNPVGNPGISPVDQGAGPSPSGDVSPPIPKDRQSLQQDKWNAQAAEMPNTTKGPNIPSRWKDPNLIEAVDNAQSLSYNEFEKIYTPAMAEATRAAIGLDGEDFWTAAQDFPTPGTKEWVDNVSLPQDQGAGPSPSGDVVAPGQRDINNGNLDNARMTYLKGNETPAESAPNDTYVAPIKEIKNPGKSPWENSDVYDKLGGDRFDIVTQAPGGKRLSYGLNLTQADAYRALLKVQAENPYLDAMAEGSKMNLSLDMIPEANGVAAASGYKWWTPIKLKK